MQKHNNTLEKCPYCKKKFYPRAEDIEYVDSIKMYFCPECGEEFPADGDIKINEYAHYEKADWR
jgi:DNA-directed RNA polymerase subunit RPC12/RpoP